MFCLATQWLEKNSTTINALNVFPVPDGDTGTNMLLTMRSTMAEAARQSDTNASNIALAMSRGALMGARGNSGVILSQIMRGFADGLEDKETFGPDGLARALDYASKAAYRGVSKPREGTMLTVIKDVATAARISTANNGHDLIGLMEVVVESARDSVQRTPELLDVLKEAGVVDAGGQGIYVILEGILRYLQGETYQIDIDIEEAPKARQQAFIAARSEHKAIGVYGFCTELIVKGINLNQNRIKQHIESYGESVLVVGDKETIKIHVHTCHPGNVIEFAISQGSVHDIKIQNMDDQHEEFIQMRRAPMSSGNVAVIAVVTGSGLEDVFYNLGATAIIPGGQTMNPSCSDILQAINSIPTDNVIVLPNNKNVIPAANQAANLIEKEVKVLPTQSIPQGISALIAFNSEIDLDSNISEMTRAIKSVRSIEITKSVRDASLGRLKTKRGDYISLLDGNIEVASNDLSQAVLEAFEAAGVKNAEIASLYYGNKVEKEDAKKLGQILEKKYHNLEIELITGGQPHYDYIISIE